MKYRKALFIAAVYIVAAVIWGVFPPVVSGADAPGKRKIGYLPATGHVKTFIAKEQGFFVREGIDAELVEFISSADGVNALRAGKMDPGSTGTTDPLVHIFPGADLRIIRESWKEQAFLQL